MLVCCGLMMSGAQVHTSALPSALPGYSTSIRHSSLRSNAFLLLGEEILMADYLTTHGPRYRGKALLEELSQYTVM